MLAISAERKEEWKMAIARIFAVSGVKDSGKTHTLNYLAQILNRISLRTLGPDPMINPLGADARYMFDNVNGYKVGVGTSGDDGWIIDEHFKEFNTCGCDVVIVACRSRTGTASVDALARQASRRGLFVDYTTLMWSIPLAHHILVEQDIAQRIVNRI